MVDELRAAGHDVVVVNPVEVLGREADPAAYSQVAVDETRRHADAGGVDLFFAVATDDMILPAAVREIGARGIPTVNLSCEDYAEPWRIRRFASGFDLVWTTVPENAHLLRGYGANVCVMPFAANPRVFRPAGGGEEPVIGFIGTLYGARPRIFARLVQAGLPVKVFGRPPWEQYGGRAVRSPLQRAFRDLGPSLRRLALGLTSASGRLCMAGAVKRSLIEMFGRPVETRDYLRRLTYCPSPDFEALAACLSTPAINLGDILLRSTYVLRDPLLFIRLREFEAAMSGAVHLVNRKPELCAYFEEDREMLMYGDLDELIDKARFYLAPEREGARAALRRQARARALSEHTWTHRFRQIGQRLGVAFG
jgi:hypothetical protein